MMKAKVLAALAATMAVGATCAFAANPFVDVPTDSWAYKSVVELADSGIVQGVDGKYFEGNRNITRYEAAEMVAKAMAHMDRATVEQRALINKLADEYADELNNLGVRVSNLENKVGNIKFTGDARLRYRYQNDNKSKEDDNSWDYRIRLRGTSQVNDRVTATVGLSTDNQNFGANGQAHDGSNDVFADIINVDYAFGSNWKVSAGRTSAYILGGPRSYGYQYGDVFDRAQLQFNNGKFAVTGGYGKFKEGDIAGGLEKWDGEEVEMEGVKTAYGEVEGFFGNNTAVGVYYNNFVGGGNSAVEGGENINGDDNANVWIGRVTYGKTSMATPKSWDLWVEYLDAEDGAFLGGSTNSWRFGQMDNIKSWGAGIDYVFAKNAMFSVMQSFGSQTKDGPDADPEEQTRAQFVFTF